MARSVVLRGIAVLSGATVALGLLLPGVAWAAKKLEACTVLRRAEIQSKLPIAISPASPSSGALVCNYAIGAGYGKPGGGVVVIQYYGAPGGAKQFAQSSTGATKVSGRRVWWDEAAEMALASRADQMVAVSIGYTDDTPSGASLKDAMVDLAARARQRL
jgi:hypothetical protein